MCEEDRNDPARRIAETNDSPLRVLAGPGTGKTFALMNRVGRILTEGEQANRILVCTFTRTAARDLQAELTRLGVEGVAEVVAGTIHALCFRILSRGDVLALTHRVPRPLLKFEERFLLQDLHGHDLGGIRDLENLLQAFNSAWARLQTDAPGWPQNPTDQAFQQALSSWLRFHRAMLIGELIPETLRYLRDNPASPDRTAFRHVLVDEYQDLNRAEQVLLDLLSHQGALTVVGDEDQSIYSFKFAHPEGIAQFDRFHPNTHDEGLEECRRCPRLVVRMANSLISNNAGRTPRTLQLREDNPLGEVLVVQWDNMEQEAQGIAELIRERVTTGNVDPGRILVLAPRRQFGYAIRDALNGENIPAHSFFHEEALEGNPKSLIESQAQQAFTLLCLLADPEDRVALRCWCGFGSPSLRNGEWARMREYCEETSNTPWTALDMLASHDITLPRTNQIVSRFEELREAIAAMENLIGMELVDALFPDGQDWAAPFRNLSSSTGTDDFEPQELKDALRTSITQPELPTDVDYVRVMSLHKAKGLTAEMVVVLGCVEGLVPSIKHGLSGAAYNRALEEQRRLFYVAITRTRRTLVLSSVTRLPLELAHRMGARVRPGSRFQARTISSRFVNELGRSRPAAITGAALLAALRN